MRTRLISDGTPKGSRLQDAEGRDIKGIKSLGWKLRVGDPLATVDVELDHIEVEAEGVARFFVAHPEGGGLKQVSKVIFADGTEWAA